MSLPPGYCSALSNWRLKGGALEVRGGMTASLGTILASSSFRGKWEGFLWGSYTVVVAVYDATRTRVLYSTDCITFTELTASSGAFGNTRLTGNAPVSFAVVPDPFSLPTDLQTERLLFTDGTGAVREAVKNAAYEKGGLTFPVVCTLTDIAPPLVADYPVRVEILEFSFLTIGTSSGPTFSNPDTGDMDLAMSGSTPNQVMRLTIATSVDITDETMVAVSSGSSVAADSVASRQFIIGVNTAYTMLWDKLKVELGSVVLWDPTAPQTYAKPFSVPLDADNNVLWVFQYPPVIASGTITGNLIFTWVAATNEAPTASTTADIFLIGLTYASPGYADWSIGITSCNLTSNAESPGMIYKEYVTQRLSDYGAPIMKGLRMRRDPRLKALYKAKIKNVVTAEKDAGVDAVRFYYRRQGETRYRYLNYFELNTVSVATWSYGSGTTGELRGEVTVGPTSHYYSLPEVYMPDAYCITVPTSKCLAFANDRLLAGGASGSTRNLYVSEYRNAFRMRSFTARQNGVPDADAPLTLTVGNGVFQAIVPMSSSLLGSDTIFVFMSDGILVTGGQTSGQLQQIARVSKFGTISPFSIAELNGKIFYLDTEMQVRVLEGGSPYSITRNRVSNQTRAIPTARRAYAVGAVHNDLYYLFFTEAAGSANTLGLVWDDELREWVNDVPPKPIEGLLSWNTGTGKRLIAVGLDTADLKAYEYDLLTQSQDLDSTNITCGLTLPDIHSEDGKGIHIERVALTMDDVASGTGTITRTYKTDTSTGVSSINLDAATGYEQTARYDAAQTISGGLGYGVSARLNISLAATAGKRLYKVAAEVEPRTHFYDTSS